MLFVLLCALGAQAQDVIVRRDGSTVLARVVAVNGNEVVYKKWSDLNGPNYVMSRSDVTNINYESGRQDRYSTESNNLYSPGNQNTGIGQYNDSHLVRLAEIEELTEKAKKAKKWGIIGGCVFSAGAVVCGICCGHNPNADILFYSCMGTAVLAGASVGTGFILSHKYKSRARQLQSLALCEQEFRFQNGTSLALTGNFLRDPLIKAPAVGVGFRYNF